jgi:dTDP-4-amino-4,6-dideoxygalactose transaminase
MQIIPEDPKSANVPLYGVSTPPSLATIVADVLATGQIAVGPNIERFEQMLGDYLGNPRVTVNGDISTALTLCLFQAGVRPGDDVLMSPLVCLSTSCPVRNLFANIRWCDVDPLTGNLDPDDIPKKITTKTKAIVVYHWAGNPVDLDAIHAVARRYGLPVIEDAGEALGAEYHGKKIGSTGSDYTVFSFYPNRHLTTIDGGAIACARQEDYENLRWLKRYGMHQPSFRDKDGEINPASDIPNAGWNSYMSNVAAAIGIAQMQSLPSHIAAHQETGIYYDRRLAGVPNVTVLKRPPNSRSAYWVYTFLVEARDRVFRRLIEQGIQASKVHLRNDLYTCFGVNDTALPGVDQFSSRCLSIPCGWWVADRDRTKIADSVCQALLSE